MQKSSSGYAEGQIRVLLADLSSTNHGLRVKALKRFQDYVSQQKPELNDDDVMYLFVGDGHPDSSRPGGASKKGLLYYAGMDSGKHGGQLKRVAAPAIGLVRFLVTLPPWGLEGDSNMFNMFFEIFVSLTTEELSKINFIKHILGEERGGIFGDSRSGNTEDALEILALLVREHRNPDGDQPEPIDITLFLGDNKPCRDRLNQYMQKSNSDVVIKVMQQFKVAQTKAIASKWDDDRPKKWDDDNFKPIPLQEGEDGEIDCAEDTIQVTPVPDPLGLSELDLRATQKLNASGRLGLPSAVATNRQGTRARRNSATSVDDDGDERETLTEVASVLPQDKSFSPSLFLTLVHGGITLDQLNQGSENLRAQLLQQNSQRENLVRVHFGLFVHCAEGLEWLKGYRKGSHGAKTIEIENGGGGETKKLTLNRGDTGEHMLARAKIALEGAKNEATDTLRPILDRMRKMRKFKTADQVLRRLTPTLEHPHKMRLALNRGDFDEVVSIYQKVQAIPSSNQLRVVLSVKSGAEGIIDELKLRCRTAIDSPEPDVVVLLRYAKIIAELEGEDSYREHIKQCFNSQLRHFNSQIEQLMGHFAEDAFTGFCLARDLRAEAEADAKAKGAHGVGARHSIMQRTTSMSAPSTSLSQNTALEWLPDMTPDEDVVRARITSTGRQIGTSARGGFQFDDEAYFDDKEMGSSGMKSAVELLTSTATTGESEDDRGARPGFNVEQDYKLNQLLLATKVRELYVSRLVNVASKWLPCLHRLVLEATNKQSVGGAGLWMSGDHERTNRAKVNIALNRKKGPPPMLMLGSAMIACGEAIKLMILGVKDPTSFVSQDSNALSTQIAGRDAAFEAKVFNQDKMVEIRATPVFNHEVYSGHLNNPALSRCVTDAGDLFDLMTSLVPCEPIVGEKGVAQSSIAVAVKHSELFLYAVGIIREIARGGEVALASRVMDRLQEKSLMLFESKGQKKNDPIGILDKSLIGVNSIDLDKSGDDVKEPGELETITIQLNKLISRCLIRLSKKMRRPEWVAQTVRDELRKLFGAFIDEMQRQSLLLDDWAISRLLNKAALRGRTRTVTASALQSPELLHLESQLKQVEVSQDFRSEYLIDLVRAFANLRTSLIPRIWKEVKILFPPSTESSSMATGGNLDAFYYKVRDEDIKGLKKAPSASALNAADLTSSASSSSLYNRLMKTVGNDNVDANVNIEEVVRIEGITASNYVFYKLQNLRVIVAAGYAVLTKREAAGAWRSTERRPDGFIVPPHLSRLLLVIGREKSFLNSYLGTMMIETGETVRRQPSSETTGTAALKAKGKTSAAAVAAAALTAGEKYQDYLFKEICQGLLELYADLVAKLNFNCLGRETTTGVDLASVLSGSMSPNCRHPFCYGQASEELAYLVNVIRPFLRSSGVPLPTVQRHNPVGGGEEFLLAAELNKEASIYHMGVQR